MTESLHPLQIIVMHRNLAKAVASVPFPHAEWCVMVGSARSRLMHRGLLRARSSFPAQVSAPETCHSCERPAPGVMRARRC
jgi:hypothetical protein